MSADATLDPAALVSGEGAMRIPRDIVHCTGPDTVKFLHSLLSQDLIALQVGTRTYGFMLTPQGKVVAFTGIARVDEAAVDLDTDAGFGEVLLTTLLRYRIRTKCELTLEPNRLLPMTFREGILVGAEPGAPTVDFDPVIYTAARVVTGWPVGGREITTNTVPNETGLLGVAVNFKKGCYVGQELVERIDSRGATTPTRLVRVGAVVPLTPEQLAEVTAAPVEITVEGKAVGLLTSVANLPEGAEGLGTVRRTVQSEQSVELAFASGRLPAAVEDLGRP